MDGFSQKRNFPNCNEAIDGKHLLIHCRRVTAVVNAACVLHNFLGCDVISAPDSCATVSLLSTQLVSRGRIGAVGAALRDRLCYFINDKSAVLWPRQSAHLDVNIYWKPRK
ncbi:hypothetical protein MRX96_021293 [Rhipicephalus microplus]